MYRLTAAGFCLAIKTMEEVWDVSQESGHDCYFGSRHGVG